MMEESKEGQRVEQTKSQRLGRAAMSRSQKELAVVNAARTDSFKDLKAPVVSRSPRAVSNDDILASGYTKQELSDH